MCTVSFRCKMKGRKNKSRSEKAPRPFRPWIHAALPPEWLAILLLCAVPTLAQAPQSGRIRGTVVDKDGLVISNVMVTLSQDGATSTANALSDSNGSFTFAGVATGPFRLTFTAGGFATQTISDSLLAGEDHVTPQVVLAVGSATVDVDVTQTREEIAEQQLRVEEKQRLFGVLPNFYVTYDPNPVALTSRQKFRLAWKSTIDPVSFGITGIVAGFEQAADVFPGYGQGAEGYAKRYGAAYADSVSGNFIGGAILPSLLKQDPRYYYKGTGTTKSRTLYAMANAFICKGDNGRWQPNYSSVIGDLASAGISNLYYPAADRMGAALTFQNAGIGIGANALGNIFQEFLLRKLTPHSRNQQTAKP